MTVPFSAEFRAAYEQGKPWLLWKKISGDTETPVTATLKLKHLSATRALLESALPGHKNRYSLLAFDPDMIWELKGGEVSLTTDGKTTTRTPAKPLESLREFIAASQLEIPPELQPMAAPVIGFLGFDCIRYVENIPGSNPDSIGLPEAKFMRPRISIVFDSLDHSLTLVNPIRPRRGLSAKQAHIQAAQRFEEIEACLQAPLNTSPTAEAKKPEVTFRSNMNKADFVRLVQRAKDYILAGDIFQVVLSQRFSAPLRKSPFSFYRALRSLNPSPFMFFLDFDGLAVTGASPEILVRLSGGEVTVRPIAGTRPRGKTPAEDSANAAELLADEKELAEHVMLLDLGRNDVSRVSIPSTVRVTEQNVIEYYSHVMHIVSNVTGALLPGLDALDALIGGFPAGTVSGAPKLRALEIIQEQESCARGIYGGAIGYFAGNGDMDTCIALRTAVIKDGVMYVQAGAGIVADSDPEAEWRECRLKASALFAAANR